MIATRSAATVRQIAIALLPVLGVWLAGCADRDPIAPEAARPNFITDGVPTGSSFGNVGVLFVDLDGDGGLDVFCSGGLISPTVFLTAAHCFGGSQPDAQAYVSFEPEFPEFIADLIVADAFHVDPGFGHDIANLHDLAVVILPVGSTAGITPLQLPPAGYLDGLAAQGGLHGELIINVGYGADASQRGRPVFELDGVRKTSESPFRALRPNWLVVSMNTNATGEGGVCFGDSGSPHFLDGNPGLAVATTTGGDPVCRSLSYNFRLDTPTARAFLGQHVSLP